MTLDPQYVAWADPSCPAGTAVDAYTTTPVGISTVWLWRMEVRIPPGHQGMTGIALVDSGSFVIPYDPGGQAWLIGDDDDLSYDYGRELGANVALATYNTGTFVHAWQVRLVYTPMSAMGLTVPKIEVGRPAVRARGK